MLPNAIEFKTEYCYFAQVKKRVVPKPIFIRKEDIKYKSYALSYN